MVFRGRFMGSDVAAKQMFANTSAEDKADFFREAAMLTKLRHPCIVNMYGVATDPEGSLYLVMEYCGGPLNPSHLPTFARAKLSSRAGKPSHPKSAN